jgi:hypothetical protein
MRPMRPMRVGRIFAIAARGGAFYSEGMSGTHSGAADKTPINLPLSPDAHSKLRWLAYVSNQSRAAVVDALIEAAATARGYPPAPQREKVLRPKND